MKIKEVGFRPLYHYVSAFELNADLKKVVKDCPEADKATHAVFYGYIDPEGGLMLELLCVGKKAPKNFYFKDPYTGKRVTIKASDLDELEFVFFPEFDDKVLKTFAPKIDPLKEYDADEKLEKTRELAFLDEFRSPQYPDDVRVVLLKEGLKPEEVWIHMTHPGDQVLCGKLLNQPYQDYGINRGDPIDFYVRDIEENKIVLVKDFDERNYSELSLDDGSLLKQCIKDYLKDKDNKEAIANLLTVLRSSKVFVPCDLQLSDEAKAIMDRLEKDGKDLDTLEGKEADTVQEGMNFIPGILESEGHKYFPAFSSDAEIGDKAEGMARVNMPFVHAIDMALDEGVDGIVINPYTDDFFVDKELFGTIRKLKPLAEEPDVFEPGGNLEPFTNREDLDLAITVGKMDIFNFALYTNKVPPIRGVKIINKTGSPITGLSIKITSDVPFFKEYESSLPSIPSGKPIALPDPRLRVNGTELAGLTEAVNASIVVELCKDGETICGVRGQMEVLAYDQWQGGETYRDILPAFVVPNHPLIPTLMHDAAEILGKWNKPTSLEGYQKHDPNRVRDLAAAAYAAIQKKNIVYANPPASFYSVAGQRIRTPETIMEQRLGTCMDMTLLYAAVLEAMGLDPILVMLKGHIFAGVWLKDRSIEELKAGDVVIENREQLTMRIDNGTDEMTFIECTAMCSSKQVNYEEAETIAKQEGLRSDDYWFAIDVKLARIHGINPIASRMKDGGDYKIEVSEKTDDEITDAPTDLGLTITDVTDLKPKKISGKRELWESKLLDLSSRNMLLNLPLNSSIEPIMSSHIDELEDALSDGHEFNLLSAPKWIAELAYAEVGPDGKEGKPKPWLIEALKANGVFEMTEWPVSAEFDFNEKFRQEYRSHRLYTFCGDKQLDRELTHIYRAARSSQQENGVSSLYLAVGLLRWFPDPESEEPCYAPLILLPVEIVRKSANQGYALHARDEEPHFNTTLLEMLKQNFGMEIPGLDPLPTDDHGTNIKKVFSIVRGALYSVNNWDVVESCVIGNFSFAQFAMWNDIHTAGDVLDNSKIVRSLIKGHVDWDVSAIGNVDDEQVYLPITVDATQLKAIKMAAHGTTFVLHGPPGTGKSQTITGMIANLMAQGKKVLFVAEKMAALSVVQRRLALLGIDDFCLELHSDKANKKHILTQLDKALAIQQPSRKTEYEESLKKTLESRKRIDGYAEHLHQERNCGMSLREIIALYETVRDGDQIINFDINKVGELTKSDIKAHIPLIGQLTAAGDAMVGVSVDRFIGIGLTSYNAEVRSKLASVVGEYKKALSGAKLAGDKVAQIVGSEPPKNQSDLSALNSLLSLYQEKKGTEPLLLKLLKHGTKEAFDYFAKKEIVDKENEIVQRVWIPAFLNMDMNAFLLKHDAATKKFIGKGAAMNQVTSELQRYSKIPIVFEQIPELLRRVIGYQNMVKDLGYSYSMLSDSVKQLINELPDKNSYSNAYAAAVECQKQAERFPGGLDAIIGLSGNTENSKAFDELGSSINRLNEAEKDLNALLNRVENTNEDNWFETENEFCDYILEHQSVLKDWGLYNQVRQECLKVGLEPVVLAFENGMPVEKLENAYRKGLYYSLINNIITQDDILSSFSGATFNEAINQFKKLDEEMLEQTKQEIYYRLATNIPTSVDSPEIGKELNLLRKAIGSDARGMSIRNLFERIPNVLQELCPCMLMSPNSVAQYLAQRNDLFDVVIFDEASQLPTCKAVGALSRAKDAVIVGDPKQMPPTSFFSGAGPEVDDLALDDLDSILDDALALGIPSQHLQWHYRSSHESLIAFSNNKFYGNKMYTFPSANDRERHVNAVFVEGLYTKSTNPKEAEAVVAEIVRRFNDPELRKQSIGVVTFNVKQQTLIENLLTKQFENNQELDVWANSGDDPLFIKNLENVQGDERDVILFSIGYGPDEKGHVSNNFGPINKSGGGKRLNVAFSRARITMTIFTSIHSSDIRITETSPDGLIAFHDFLKYAEGSDIYTESRAEVEAKLARAGIMQRICKAITEHGFQCVTMVGHSDFHVDIAVIDPFDSSKYIMGILLDGDGYRQTKNTRDREVAQLGVLRHLGWNLCRVWTVDWWDNRDKEINKLLNKLDKLKAVEEEKYEKLKAEEEANKAEIKAREAENKRIKAELEAQAAQVIAEDEEADREQKTVTAPVIVSEEENRQIETKTVDFTVAEKKTETSSSQNTAEIIALIQKLQATGAKLIDKRNNGGALWVVGGNELAAIMKEFKAQGIYFNFKAGGGKATGGMDGWWSKTTIDLSVSEGEAVNDVNTPAEAITQSEAVQVVETSEEEMPRVAQEPVEDETEIISTVSEIEESDDKSSDSQSEMERVASSENTKVILEPVEYKSVDLEVTPISSTEFAAASFKKNIADRILEVVNVEAPILKSVLMRRIFVSYGVSKGNAVVEAFEKALRAAKVKTAKQKGIVYCWNDSQDPKSYYEIRVSAERSGDEICQQEIRNAVCYVLRNKGVLGRDELVKETSLVFGYKRLGPKLEAALLEGVKWSKSSGAIVSAGTNKFALAPEDSNAE